MIRKNNAATAQEMIGIVFISVAVLFLAFSVKKYFEKKVVVKQERPSQEQGVKKGISADRILNLKMRANLSEGEGRRYIELWYEVTNIGQKQVFVDEHITVGKNLFFEMTDPKGKKGFVPKDSSTFPSQERFIAKEFTPLSPGKLIKGSVRVYPEDYPFYLSGVYSISAHLTIDTSSLKSGKPKTSKKLISAPYALFIPAVPQAQ